MPSKDRVEHTFRGTNASCCLLCKKPFSNHRAPRKRVDIRYRDERVQVKRKMPIIYVGIDGEGQGRENHVYNLLAASNEDGEHEWHIEDINGLSTQQCLEFITDFPRHVRLFSYSFNYDLTKLLKDIGDRQLYYLFRPELRQRFGKDAFKGPRPVIWNEWRLNLQGTKFSVRRNVDRKNAIIWDIWKFYQSKFTSALTDWKVGEKEEIERMILMKDKRHLFDRESRESVRAYCFSECRLMAGLARKLTEAHDKVGLKLKNYYGAGSSASAMLDEMNVKPHIKEAPEEMIMAVSQAFFGGRFDNSVVGTITGKVHGWDISSAYPYHIHSLPCLIHGQWVHTRKRHYLEASRAALVRYTLKDSLSVNTKRYPWGPFPFRTPDGSITYPAVSGGGWVWRDEFIEAEKLFPNVEFVEAWLYHTPCNCEPFKDIPYYYNERCRIGKEGPGMVIKLAVNSCYGKTAQSVGNGQYRSWIWAGITTSGCRAQVLRVLGMHKDWRNMLMVATDGILTLEDIQPPDPRNTGTNLEYKDDKGVLVRKPLGGWEHKPSDRGVFIARPGVYFPLDPTDKDIKIVRGRGVGRGVILENWKSIIATWKKWNGALVPVDYDRKDFDRKGWPIVNVGNVSRFCGAKSSVSRRLVDGKYIYHRATGNHMGTPPEPAYGQWVTREVAMSFNPMPKREGIEKDGRSLTVRRLPEYIESAPYSKANISEEARTLLLMALEANEQPDVDFADYETNELLG